MYHDCWKFILTSEIHIKYDKSSSTELAMHQIKKKKKKKKKTKQNKIKNNDKLILYQSYSFKILKYFSKQHWFGTLKW